MPAMQFVLYDNIFTKSEKEKKKGFFYVAAERKTGILLSANRVLFDPVYITCDRMSHAIRQAARYSAI